MLKNKKLLLIAGGVCLLVCVALVLALCGGPGGSGSQTGNGETATYTIEVSSASGVALADVSMFVYEDSTQQELVAVLKTDGEGKASFMDAKRDTYVAVLDKIPTGYEAEEFYPLTGELTQIVLQAGQMTDVDVQTLTYKLGDAMMDFTVIGPDGTEYTLSQLFEGKKAVVLNFFYNECQPCMSEFPYLQEAYEAYKDDIAVLAMNPVNTDDAAIAAKQKELGVTFPMVKCGPEWESIMQITAYPTTVVIDRFGNICLIHKGSVPDAKTFKDAFAYFAAEDYEQKLIEAIGDLAVEEPEGTKENPTDVGGTTSFEVTVEPGKVVYNDLWKVFGMYLTIRNENAYVVYKDKTYYPENGVVSLKVTAPDTYTPATVGFGNSGTKTETFKVSLSIPAGTLNNPYKLTLGEFDAKVAAGNEQGVYYTYTATEDGTLTMQCLSSTRGVDYDFILYNLNSYAQRNMSSEGILDAAGLPTVSVEAKKGQKVQFSVGTLPDSTNSYPAGSFKFKASFTAHEIKEEEKIPMTDYTVTILDDSKKPAANVSVLVKVDGKDTAFTTNTEGVAKISLPTGSYQGSFYLPDGYTAEKTAFELTEKAPNVTLTISPIKQTDYTVKVVGPDGEAIANTFVKIGDNPWQRTDANGIVTMHLDVSDHTVTIMVPTGYTGQTAYQFAEGATELVITLGIPETEEPTDPSEPADPSEPTDPSEPVDPSEPTDPTDPSDPTDPTEPTEPEPEDCVYTVTVQDAFNAPQAGIDVIFMQDGVPVHFATTDENGLVKLDTNSAQSYTVELVFSGTEYYYNKAKAVLSGDNRNLVIKLSTDVNVNDYTPLYILNDNPAYTLYVGGTHVELGSGKPNFSAENGNNCFFVFTPQEAGTYQITVDDPNVELSLWSTPVFINRQYGSKDEGRDNALTESISGTSVGNTTYVIGVSVDGSTADAVVNVARIGDPAFSIADQPWTDWGGTGDAHAGSCKVSVSGSVTYVDIKAASGTYDIYYDEAAGYYRFSSNGKPVLVDLNVPGSAISLYVRINGKDHHGGSAVRRYFYDASGAFIKKEDYTDYLSACFACAGLEDAEGVGYHVLTKELMYVLQNGFIEWWDPNSANYLENSFATANKEYAWMFACCMAN